MTSLDVCVSAGHDGIYYTLDIRQFLPLDVAGEGESSPVRHVRTCSRWPHQRAQPHTGNHDPGGVRVSRARLVLTAVAVPAAARRPQCERRKRAPHPAPPVNALLGIVKTWAIAPTRRYRFDEPDPMQLRHS